ncbi:dienelactone hydrolase family protein [Haliangium sp.]|uniref:dienelactone hydrolase family protein n=1 Tax=Haliangium sp. TaxID=2663208 RepID=UPI003D1487B5
MLPDIRPLADDFHCTPTTLLGQRYPVWRSGDGPGVVVIHEIPGITPTVSRFARIVRDHGFTVFLPELFGENDRPATPGSIARQIVRVCISREFHTFSTGGSSPIVDWLRALCDQVHAELGGPGVGALGMCLTGNFALALSVSPSVKAPVLSQPSLPFPVTTSRKRAVHASAQELSDVRKRIDAEGLRVLGLRFTHDPLCPKQRFQRLRDELGDGFEAIEIYSGSRNQWGIRRTAHSVLTEELVDDDGHPTKQALDRVLAFFREHLQAA